MIVLVVDPDRRSRRPVRTFLENRGVSVIEADDLEAARDACAAAHPGAIVTEVFAEPENTLARLEALAPGVPILMWAGSRTSGVEEKVRAAGYGFLGKPALPSEVAFALGRLSPPPRPRSLTSARPAAPELRRRNRQRPTLG